MAELQSSLVERVRAILEQVPSTREISMFGGRAFMVRDRLAVSAMNDGSLLVRVAAQRHEELVAMPGAAQAEMGDSRSMGTGWIAVSEEAVRTDRGLAFWMEAALELTRTPAVP